MPFGRLRALLGHLAFSAVLVAVIVGPLMLLWFPGAYATLTGGRRLVAILIGIDLALGPCLTFVVANPHKPRRELRRDVAIVIALQLAGFGYGLSVMVAARPVWMAFEVDRMRVVTSADIDHDRLGEAPPNLRDLPWTGPKLIAAVVPTDPAEQLRTIDAALAGHDLATMPKQWRDYASLAPTAWSRARSVQALLDRHPAAAPAIERIARAAGRRPAELRFLPVQHHDASAIVLLLDPLNVSPDFLPFDGFF